MIYRRIIFFLIFFLLFTNPFIVYSKEIDNESKTIMIILDEMDFETISSLGVKEKAVGIINMRTEGLYKNEGKESFFMSLATGRRQSINKGKFRGNFIDENGYIVALGYEEIIKDIKREGNNKEVTTLSNQFNLNGKKIGYLGNDISSLLAADSRGIIKYGYKNILYTRDFIINKSDEILNKVDLLIVSLNIKNDQRRLDILRNYIKKNSNNNIIIFPQNISDETDKKFNKTLYPIIYIDNTKGEGLLISDTTKREGIITNLDIMTHILNINSIKSDNKIGGSIDITPSSNPVKKAEGIFNRVLNLNIIKNILHLIVILLELYLIFSYVFTKRENYYKRKIIMNSIVMGIFLSFIFAFFNISNYMILYLILIISLSIVLGFFISLRKKFYIGLISLATYIIIIYGVFYNNSILYNSFLGYNNILVGGRFYGLNNSIMGVVLITSIISFFTISNYIKSKNIKSKNIKSLLLFIFFITNILAFSSSYGSNVGGYITSIILLLLSVYFVIFEKGIEKKDITIGILVIATGILINIGIDLNGNEISHLGKTVFRIKSLGVMEIIYMVVLKIKQLLFMLIVPPWSIIFISQIFYIFKYYKDKRDVFYYKKNNILYLEKLFKISLITGFVGLLINDTGVIAFVYIITYLMAFESNLDEAKAIYK